MLKNQIHCLHRPRPKHISAIQVVLSDWAARCYTGLLINLTPNGIVFSFHFLFLCCHYGSESMMPCIFIWPSEHHDHAYHCRPSSYLFVQLLCYDLLHSFPMLMNCFCVPSLCAPMSLMQLLFVKPAPWGGVHKALSSCLYTHVIWTVNRMPSPIARNVLP